MIPDGVSYRVRGLVGRSVLGSVGRHLFSPWERAEKVISKTLITGETWQIVLTCPEEILVIPINDSGRSPQFREYYGESLCLRKSVAIAIGASNSSDTDNYPLASECAGILISIPSQNCYDISDWQFQTEPYYSSETTVIHGLGHLQGIPE